MRLDNYLVKKLKVKSRTKAQELIGNGFVRSDGVVVTKNSLFVEQQNITVDEFHHYVSRSALKLKNFLDELEVDLENLDALDIGASRGGFTQVLLERGVRSVDAVDVGTNQLDEILLQDDRVRSFEQTDIRNFKSAKRYGIVVSDVSFISLSYILHSIDSLSSSLIILLFKPQFEVGRVAKRDKRGVVLDAQAIEDAQRAFEDDCKNIGWRHLKKERSSLSGKEGNQEWCYCFTKERV